MVSHIFGPRWPYWLGVTILTFAAIEALLRDLDRATYLLVLGGLVMHGWWLGLLTDRVDELKRGGAA